MSQKEFFYEERIFNRRIMDNHRKGVLFNHWMDSTFYPGFVGKSSGGQYALYQLMVSGSVHTQAAGQDFFAEAGDFVISLGRRKYDWVKCNSAVPAVRQCFSIHHSVFHDMLVREFFPQEHIKIKLTAPEKVLEIMQEIKKELSGNQDGAHLAGLQMQLLQELFLQHTPPDHPEQFKNILQYINRHLQSPQLGREGVAEHFHISIRSLSRMFQKYLSMPPGKYIVQQRLEMVKSRLAVVEMPLKEIAWNCGFNSVNFMVRQFRKRFDITPGEYRKQNGGGKITGHD